MKIDYESLLEFEESLRSTSVSSHIILLNNLELKIESLRIASFDNESDIYSNSQITDFTDKDLDELFDKYSFSEDAFNTCSKCGRGLDQVDLYQSCCKSFVKNCSTIHSKLERSYWLSLINNPTRTINTLPNYTELLCLQQGIPNQLREKVWTKMFLLNTHEIPQASMLVYNNFQHSYNQETSSQISKDLKRTFPSVDFFKKDETIQNLSTILNVYANYDAELGYCQGLLFLVGVLYYHFHANSELTFHCLVSIMETENELHDIFTASTMSDTLNTWLTEFLTILKATDSELHDHLTSLVELQAFLYQWWMSFISSHAPDLSIVNRIMDFCIIQGWKTGLFKISLGLILINKPILMSLEKGDEEVIYQHMLNESKWGNVINDLDLFFGDLLLKWDESLFVTDCHISSATSSSSASSKLRPVENQPSYLVGKLKKFSLNFPGSSAGSARGRSDTSESSFSQTNNRSSLSVFSTKPDPTNTNRNDPELDSIYSDVSEVSSTEQGKSFADYLKLPYLHKRGSVVSSELPSPTSFDRNELEVENHTLKALLKKAYLLIDQDSMEATTLKNEISKAVDVSN